MNNFNFIMLSYCYTEKIDKLVIYIVFLKLNDIMFYKQITG